MAPATVRIFLLETLEDSAIVVLTLYENDLQGKLSKCQIVFIFCTELATFCYFLKLKNTLSIVFYN